MGDRSRKISLGTHEGLKGTRRNASSENVESCPRVENAPWSPAGTGWGCGSVCCEPHEGYVSGGSPGAEQE